MTTTYFDGYTTVDEIKTRYRELTKQHHPDLGGDEETMKAINAELETALASAMNGHYAEWRKENEDREHAGFSAAVFADILRQIIDWNMTIEIIGFWIYAFESFEYKDQLKELGFWFSKKHRAWIYSGDKKRKIRSRYTTDDVRGMHGSETVRRRSDDERKPQFVTLPA